jgi:uncharacterized membrane protein YheB (UPF0754 family)
MPVLTSVFIISIAAIGGWLIAALFIHILFRPYNTKKVLGFPVRGIIPSLKPALGNWLAAAIQKELLSVDSVEKRIDDPALMAQLRPEIEKHIDRFLKEKLKEAFPLLAGLMGEKTLGTLKVAFLAEVELIFPSVLKSFSANLLQQWQPAKMIEGKLSDITQADIERMVKAKAWRQLLFLKLIGALAGITMGVLQVLLLIYAR